MICHAGPGTFLPFILLSHELVALVDSRLTVITADAYEWSLLELPDAAQALLGGVEAIVGQQQRTIVALASSHHRRRLRQMVEQLAEDHARVARDGALLQLPITHELARLAEMIGSARETVTRAVDGLEQDGFLLRAGEDRGYVLRVSPGGVEC